MAGNPRPDRRNGVALVSALMVLVILMIIASGFVQLTARDVRSSQTVGDSLTTLYLAEAGIEYAMWLNKHNMNIYPNLWYDYNRDGTADDRGTCVSIMKPTTGADRTTMEHVVINDLAFSDNWLGPKQYCGTFQVEETIVNHPDGDGKKRITITSIGRVRQVPVGWVWGTSVLDRTALTTTDFQNVRSQRTLNVVVDMDPNDTNISTTNSTRMQELQWYERFR